MLGTANVIAFIPTTDYEAARSFYEGVLGLRFVRNDGFAMILDANGIMLRVAKAAPDFKPVAHTILGWEVPDIEAAVATLGQRGVRFEHFFPQQDARGIWTAPTGDRVAWFKDPDGNTLSVSQHVEPLRA